MGWLIALALAMLPAAADSRAVHSRYHRDEPQPKQRPLPDPALELPLEIPNSQYVRLAWSDVTGWRDDDHLAAYGAFRTSCQPIVAQNGPAPDSKTEKITTTNYMTLGQKIQRLRTMRGLNQSDLAALINIEASTLSKIVHDNSKPHFELIEKISKALGVTVDELINFDERTQININNSHTSGNSGFVSYGGNVNDVEFVKNLLLSVQTRLDNIDARLQKM